MLLMSKIYIYQNNRSRRCAETGTPNRSQTNGVLQWKDGFFISLHAQQSIQNVQGNVAK